MEQRMKIAIVGGGFTGLSAAYKLLKSDHEVTIFEKDNVLGGLAHGFKQPSWDWSLEKAYHHFFTNDDAIFALIKELGLTDKLIVKRPITANLLPNGAGIRQLAETSAPEIYQFDSPTNLLQFPGLPMIDKLRTGAFLAALKLTPWWQPFENITAEQLFVSFGGKRAWETIWKPLMIGKFGDYADSVAASWLWARIKKRTPKLCYIEGGFQTLVDRLSKVIHDQGGMIYTNTHVLTINKKSTNDKYSNLRIKYQNNLTNIIQQSLFDRVLITVPTPISLKLFPHSSFAIHHSSLLTIPHLHAQTLILETRVPILEKTYWLNILDRSFPFLAVVAHTNFMDPKHYGGHHLTYFGNYLPTGHPYLSMTKNQLLNNFMPYIKRINPKFHLSDLQICHLFIGYYAQPVHQLHYSQKIPSIDTPITGIFLANMDYIYPWDRGTNYAVELGIRAASAMSSRPRI